MRCTFIVSVNQLETRTRISGETRQVESIQQNWNCSVATHLSNWGPVWTSTNANGWWKIKTLVLLPQSRPQPYHCIPNCKKQTRIWENSWEAWECKLLSELWTDLMQLWLSFSSASMLSPTNSQVMVMDMGSDFVKQAFIQRCEHRHNKAGVASSWKIYKIELKGFRAGYISPLPSNSVFLHSVK